MRHQHCISVEQFDRNDLDDLFREAAHMTSLLREGGGFAARGKIMVTFFYEPSTRTRLSFEAAMNRLGGRVLSTDHASTFSSVAKGEDIADSIRTTACYADIIVLRSKEEGHARIAAEASVNALTGKPVPVVNAGDGKGEHPTQALLDVFTVLKRFERLDGLTVAMVGDLKRGRTVHSLAKLLALYPVGRLLFVAPPAFQMPDEIRGYVADRGVRFEESRLVDAVPRADVVYMTRLQKERLDVGSEAVGYADCLFGPDLLDRLKRDAIVMHPLPRNEEIDRAVDADERAWYFKQAAYGVPVRMALVKKLLRRN